MNGFFRRCVRADGLLAWLICLNNTIAFAQDLYVKWVTVTPGSGQAGDTVSLQARIGNNGPGMALAFQVQWFLSEDSGISVVDMALGELDTLSIILYSGDEITITKEIALPPFGDPVPPSDVGLLIDPHGFITDSNRSNNSGSAPFEFTGLPAHSFSIPWGITIWI